MAKQSIIRELHERFPGWRWWFRRRPEGHRVYHGWHDDYKTKYGHPAAVIRYCVQHPSKSEVFIQGDSNEVCVTSLDSWDGVGAAEQGCFEVRS
tara:strand:- start:1937 stop:2218 length:282 start_codon:yes stop_codon:yes gene_type:complete